MQSKPTTAVQVKCTIGLGALLSTLLIYSACVIAFIISYESVDFVILYAPVTLVATALIALIILMAALKGKLLGKPLLIVSGPLYVVGALGFVLLASFGIVNDWLTVLCALTVASGDVLLCLVWGRIFSHFELRQALIAVSLASALAAIAYWLFISLPIALSSSLFIILALLAAAMPLLIRNSWGLSERLQDVSKAQNMMRSLLDVAGLPVAGLAACSFCFALLRSGLSESYSTYVISVLIVVSLLLIFAFFMRRALNLHGLYLTFLPVLSVLVLAVAGFTEQVSIGSEILMLFVFILYIAAAIITLATLAAVANVGEFSSDLLFATALFLFGAFSALGQGAAELVSEEMVSLVVIVVTMVYALVSLLTFFLRWFREQRDFHYPRMDGNTETSGSKTASEEPELTACEILADTYQLTSRELEILVLLADGHRGPYISETLFISQNTVRTHIHNIYRKLEVSSREDILRITHPEK